MFGYVEKFTNKALTFISNSYFIAVNTTNDELRFALAYYTKKHPVIGLSTLGFALINGLTHLGALINGGNMMGGITGIFIFLPLVIWTSYACLKYELLPKRGLVIAVVSGIIGHIGVFGLYIINKLCGSTVLSPSIIIVAFLSIIVAWILCRVLNVDDTRVSA